MKLFLSNTLTSSPGNLYMIIKGVHTENVMRYTRNSIQSTFWKWRALLNLRETGA